ncbi:retrovirus-related pol polyprotein from transposon TNT 1-94 [Tanacetum coccineum]|uniref:Retrovirus-related pol polyprotein from transposon TNT 1-94 n=1 Tax=Tanacetum coccineum TaxID=301880 RepID=A0ABQ5E7I7_9ASTR
MVIDIARTRLGFTHSFLLNAPITTFVLPGWSHNISAGAFSTLDVSLRVANILSLTLDWIVMNIALTRLSFTLPFYSMHQPLHLIYRSVTQIILQDGVVGRMKPLSSTPKACSDNSCISKGARRNGDFATDVAQKPIHGGTSLEARDLIPRILVNVVVRLQVKAECRNHLGLNVTAYHVSIYTERGSLWYGIAKRERSSLEDSSKGINNVGVVVTPVRLTSHSQFGDPPFVSNKLIQSEKRKILSFVTVGTKQLHYTNGGNNYLSNNSLVTINNTIEATPVVILCSVSLPATTTINHLRNSSNLRQQASIKDGKSNHITIHGRQFCMLQVALMANLSHYGSDALAEVHNHDNVNNNMINQVVQVMPSSEQLNVVNHSETKIISDSNIIPYSQYVIESQHAAVQNSNSSAQQDALILSVIEQLKSQVVNCTKINLENKSVNDTLTAELERYKEQVKVLKEGQNVDLRSNDNVSDSSAVVPNCSLIGNVIISKVYYVEGLGHNLFSVGQFCDSNLEVAFRQHTCFIRNLEGVDLLTGSRGNNLYTLSLGDMMASSPICLLSKASKTKSWLWHRRLSHLNFGAINHLARHGLVRGLPKLKFEKDHLCSACAMGKSKKKPHKPKSEDTNQEKLYLLHMDLCGPMRVASVNGKKYILVIVDDYSRFTWVKFLRSKDEAPDFIIKFLKMIQVRLKVTVRRIRTDNGTEFVNQTLHEYYEKIGISHRNIPLLRISIANYVNENIIKHLATVLSDSGIYIQPLFDELHTPPPNVDLPAPEVIALIVEVVAPELANSTSSLSSTTVDQDAPSGSNSQSTTETQSHVISNDVEEDDHDLDVAHMNNDPFFGIRILEHDSKAYDVIPTVVHTATSYSEHVNK